MSLVEEFIGWKIVVVIGVTVIATSAIWSWHDVARMKAVVTCPSATVTP